MIGIRTLVDEAGEGIRDSGVPFRGSVFRQIKLLPAFAVSQVLTAQNNQ